MTDRQIIRPQPGFQESFLRNPADIVIGGGAAGAGKSFVLLLDALRDVHNPDFGAVFFRRTLPQVKSQGGLWDTCRGLYGKLRTEDGKMVRFTEMPPKARFPSGASLTFSHLQYESDLASWDGSQIPLLALDELIHFTEAMFWYMLGRNRSTCGVKPRVRCATNPQPYGWVKRLISWWLYPDNHPDERLRGYPIPDRFGAVRYFIKWGEEMYWGDTKLSVIENLPYSLRERVTMEMVKSLSFVAGKLADNDILMKKDPGYAGNLMAQGEEHGKRLLDGCWYMQPGANDLFTPADIQDMFEASFVQAMGERYMTADIAMEGSDLFVIGIWDGLRLIKIYEFGKSDGKQILDTMKALADEWGVWGSRIVFDSNGVGNFLTGFFRSAFDFRSQARPLEMGGVKQNFENLRAQCLYKLSELMKERKLYVQVGGDHQDKIRDELLPHKKIQDDGINRATPKEQVKAKIGRSPDYADMLLMRMVFLIQPPSKGSYMLRRNERLLTTA